MTPPARERQPWRDNLETAAVAIATALLLKYFTLEPFQIPTGSMQPTLMGLDTARGRPGTPGLQIYDRILVDKLTAFYADPKRWEVWVFQFPLDHSNRYIKRVVGLPGEELMLAYGDVYVRREAKQEWQIVRKPPAVQRSLWREVWNSKGGGSGFWNAAGFQQNGDLWQASGSARLATVSPITDAYVHGYPGTVTDALRSAGYRSEGSSVVRDVRVRTAARPDAQHAALRIALDWGGDALVAELSGPAGNGALRLLHNDRELARADGRLRVGASQEIEVWRADEAVGISVDGVTVLRSEFISAHAPEKFHPGFTTSSRLQISTEGGVIVLDQLAIDRDLHYANQVQNETFVSVQIPENHYFMLGDNSVDSVDGRFWKQRMVSIHSPQLGDLKLTGGMMTSGAQPSENPRPGRSSDGKIEGRIFRDIYGEEYAYREDEGRLASTIPTACQTVARDAFVGRAFALFWPVPPVSPVLRVGWIR